VETESLAARPRGPARVADRPSYQGLSATNAMAQRALLASFAARSVRSNVLVVVVWPLAFVVTMATA
jgi:hypothetical protein